MADWLALGRQDWQARPFRWLVRQRGWLLALVVVGGLWLLGSHPSLRQVAAGIAIFLFGMFFLEQGFGHIASSQLRMGLRRVTARAWQAWLLGLGATVLTQSSALVLLLTLSFISAGLINLLAGISILAGASLGTTTGGWLLASLGMTLELGTYGQPLLVLGMLLISLPRWGGRPMGMALSGAGFLLLGIAEINQGFAHLSDWVALSRWQLSGWQGVILYALLGMAMTLVIQSSHGALLLVLAAVNAGQVSYDNALALVIGINVGASGPVLLGAVNASLDGKRLALLDLLFKGVTALLCLCLFVPVTGLNDALADLVGVPPLAYPLRLALFHTLFNLLAIGWLLPCRAGVARLMVRLWPAPELPDDKVHARYLDPVSAAHPLAAEQALGKEVRHLLSQYQEVSAQGLLGIPVKEMLASDKAQFQPASGHALAPMQELYQKRVKQLFGEILTFGALCKEGLAPQQREQVEILLGAARNLSEAVRLARSLQANWVSALESDNLVLQRQYRLMQERLWHTNRELERLVTASATEREATLALLAERIGLASRRDREDMELLIRGHQLAPLQAATLMNDSQTLRRLLRQLIKACRVLYALPALPGSSGTTAQSGLPAGG
ncbi:MAG: Na/Pi symporter [Aeromonadaceae bacterium]|nr:Na/Pi symporter [Aeromonadaceae bacterium]